MKKINLLIIAVLVSAVGFMTSCDDETITPKPVITFTSDNSGAVMPGDSIDITGNITAEGEIVSIKYFKGLDQYGATVTDDFNTKTTHTFSIRIAGDENFTFEVQVEDKEGQTGKNNVDITIQNTSISEYTVTLGDTGDTEGSFIDLADGKVYTISTGDDYAKDNQEVIDLFYYYGTTNSAAFYSPEWAVEGHDLNSFADLANWTTRHTTKYAKTTSADYSTIDFAGLTAGLEGVDTQEAINLADGDLVYFKLDDGRCGLISVTTVVAPGKNDKEISFSYKIQDVAPESK